jgi:hypothetical protein
VKSDLFGANSECLPILSWRNNYSWNINEDLKSADSNQCQINADESKLCQIAKFTAGLWQKKMGIIYTYNEFCMPEITYKLSYVSFNIDQ